MEHSCTYKKPYISEKRTDEVYASCISGPEYFWCQSTNTEGLNKVLRLAQEAGRAQQNAMVPRTLNCGGPCLALFSSDNQWYRAQVISRIQSKVNVVFVDYGNESEVDINDVRPLPLNLLDLAPQAFLCSLKGFEAKGSWDDDVYDEFYNFLVDKQLKVSVFNMQNHPEMAIPQYAVAIECDGAAVNAAMQKYWKPKGQNHILRESPRTANVPQHDQVKSHTVPLVTVNTFVYKEPNIPQNRMVYASCIVEPKFFWCQSADTKNLSQMSKLAQEAGQAEQDVTFAKTLGPGSPCLALYSSDSRWYRAQVISKTNNTIHVVFVDYGNESEVDMKDVRSLPPALLEQAPQAFLCCLRGFDESEGSWDDNVYDEFYSILVDKLLKVSVFSMEAHSEMPKCPQYAVELDCEGAPVNVLLQKYWRPVAKEHMTDSLHTETALVDAHVTSIDVPNMNGTSINAPKMTGTSINVPNMNGTSINAPNMNGTSINAPKMTGTSINVPNMNGTSINTPNMNGTSINVPKMTGTSINVPNMNRTIINVPKINVTSINVPNMNGTSINAPEMNGTSINAPEMNGTSINVPKMNATSINVPKMNGNTCMYKELKISQNMTAMVYATCIAEPNYFWCQFDNADGLSKVSNLAWEAGQAEQDVTFAKTLGPGSPCLALFSTDNQWYRAQVISRTGNTLHVVFVDYGNESEVDVKDARSLPQSLLDEAPWAFLCSLKGFDKSKGSWDDDVYDEFYNILVDKLLKVYVSNMEGYSDIVLPQYSVEVECAGVDVRTVVGKYWKRSLTPDRKEEKTT